MIKKTIAAVIAAAGIATVLGAAPAHAAPCKFPPGAMWCTSGDAGDSHSTRQAGDHLDRPSGKMNVNDGKKPAIQFNPSWEPPSGKTGVGDGKEPAIKFGKPSDSQ